MVMNTTTAPEVRHRTADAMRTVADELSDWSSAHDQSWRADEAAAWARQAAARVEDDTARRLTYEARRQARRPSWRAILLAIAAAATVGGVIVWASRRRRQQDPSEQNPTGER
jgi:ferric-dicitrate binding protein FerR (iron transport regulator)